MLTLVCSLALRSSRCFPLSACAYPQPPRRFDKKTAVSFHLVPRPLDAKFDPDAPKYSLEPKRLPVHGTIEDLLPSGFPTELISGNEHMDPTYERTYIKGNAVDEAALTPAQHREEALLEKLAKRRAAGKTADFGGWYSTRKEDEADHPRSASGVDDADGEGFDGDEGDEGDWDEEQFADAEVVDFSQERRSAAAANAAASAVNKARAAAEAARRDPTPAKIAAAAAAAKAAGLTAAHDDADNEEELPDLDEDEDEDGDEHGEEEEEEEQVTPAARAEMKSIARRALLEYSRRTGEHIAGLTDEDDDDDGGYDAVTYDDKSAPHGADGFDDDGDEGDLIDLDEDLYGDEGDEDDEEEEESGAGAGARAGAGKGEAAREEMRAIARRALRAYARRTGEHIDGLTDDDEDDDDDDDDDERERIASVLAAAKSGAKKPASAAAAAAVAAAIGSKKSATAAAKKAEAAPAEKAKKPRRILPYSYDYNKHFRPISGTGQFVGQNGVRVDPESALPVVPAVPHDDADLHELQKSGKAAALRAKHDGVMTSAASGLEIPVVAPGKGVQITSDFLEALEMGNEAGFLDLEDDFYELAMLEPEEADKIIREKQAKAQELARQKRKTDVIAAAADDKRKEKARAAAAAAAAAASAAAAAAQAKAKAKALSPEDDGDGEDEDVDDELDGENMVLDDAGNLYEAGVVIEDEQGVSLSDSDSEAGSDDDDNPEAIMRRQRRRAARAAARAAAAGGIYDDEKAFFDDNDLDDNMSFDPHAYLQTGAIATLRDELAAVGGAEALKGVKLPAGLSAAKSQELLEKMQLMALMEEYDDDGEIGEQQDADDDDDEAYDDDDDFEGDEGDDAYYGDEDEDGELADEDDEDAAEARRARRARGPAGGARARKAAKAARAAAEMYEDENGMAVNPEGMDMDEFLAKHTDDLDEATMTGPTRRKLQLNEKRVVVMSAAEKEAVRAKSLSTLALVMEKQAEEEADAAGIARAIDAQFKRPAKEKWDTESIVSTYSNTNNIPVLIREVRVRAGAKGKIALTRDGEIPAGVLKKHRDQVKASAEAARAAKAAAVAAASGLGAVAEAEGEDEDDEDAAAEKLKQQQRVGGPIMVDEEDMSLAGRAAAKAKALAAARTAENKAAREAAAATVDSATATGFTSLVTEEEDEDEDDDMGAGMVADTANFDRRGMSKEAKKAHKAAVKAEQAAARQRKRATKDMFTAEGQIQAKMHANNALGRASVKKFF